VPVPQSCVTVSFAVGGWSGISGQTKGNGGQTESGTPQNAANVPLLLTGGGEKKILKKSNHGNKKELREDKKKTKKNKGKTNRKRGSQGQTLA